MAAVDAVKALKPSNLVYGEVVGITPIAIKLDQKITLDSDFIKLQDGLILKKGDVVAMIMAQGGQSYFVLGKAVDG